MNDAFLERIAVALERIVAAAERQAPVCGKFGPLTSACSRTKDHVDQHSDGVNYWD
jgi:hypothetical protein